MSEYITEFFGSSSGGSYTERREEIVRCRDCKYYSEINNEERWCGAFDFVTLVDISNRFCAWGERKEDD